MLSSESNITNELQAIREHDNEVAINIIKEHIHDDDFPYYFIDNVANYAAEHNNRVVLNFAMDNGAHRQHEIANHAVRGGQYDLFESMIKENTSYSFSESMREALKYDRQDIVQLLFKTYNYSLKDLMRMALEKRVKR